MSILGRTISAKAVAVLAAALIVLALLPVMTTSPSREITLVARDMAFYVDGDFAHPNPVIDVKAGEQVRIRLRNGDRGMTHDFAVPALKAVMEGVTWNEQGEVQFTVPRAIGTYDYLCRPHAPMMRGTLRVTR